MTLSKKQVQTSMNRNFIEEGIVRVHKYIKTKPLGIRYIKITMRYQFIPTGWVQIDI